MKMVDDIILGFWVKTGFGRLKWRTCILPHTVNFEVDDVEKEWTHTECSFDLVYSRYMLGSIKDWPRLIQQAFKALKPGGYLEILEPDSEIRCDDESLPHDAPLAQWSQLFISAASVAVGSVVEAPKYKDYIKAAGFVDVCEDIFKLPNSPWPKDKMLKEVGGYHMAAFLEGLEGLSLMLFTAVHKMEAEEIQVLLAKVRADLKNKSIHTYFNL
ncbi:hypothetical protein ABW20_dc0104155 [Dactylellina cionopaga]|nr:hypothetical protein ABW20_dc0104155 [Dactylellina cionopaga]